MLPSPVPSRRAASLPPPRARTPSPAPRRSTRSPLPPRPHSSLLRPSRLPSLAPHHRTRAVALRASTLDAYIRKASASTLVAVVARASTGPAATLGLNVAADVEDAWLDAVAAAGGAPSMVAWIPATIDLSDAAAADLLRSRYAATASPTFLLFYGGRLVYAGTQVNGEPGYSRTALEAQLELALADGIAGRFLPLGHKIAPTEQEERTAELEHELRALLRATRNKIKGLPGLSGASSTVRRKRARRSAKHR